MEKGDSTKDNLLCLHCKNEGNTKCEYRRKNLPDHTKAKHPVKDPEWKLVAYESISDVFARLKKKQSEKSNSEQSQQSEQCENSDSVLEQNEELETIK